MSKKSKSIPKEMLQMTLPISTIKRIMKEECEDSENIKQISNKAVLATEKIACCFLLTLIGLYIYIYIYI